MELNHYQKQDQIEEDPEINELLKILTQTYSSTTTRQIKEAEEKLKKFDQIIINKLDKIFNLFTSNKIPLQNKKALAIRVKYIFISFKKKKNLDLKTLLDYIELLITNIIKIKNVREIPKTIIEQICESLKHLINSKLFLNKEILLIKLSQSIIKNINSDNSFIIFCILYIIVLSPNTKLININGIIDDNFIHAIKKYITSKSDINQSIKIVDLLSLSLKKLLYLEQAKYKITNIINELYEYLFRILLDYCTDENCFMSFVNNYLQDNEEHIKQKSNENLLKSKIFLVLGFMIECEISINNDNTIHDKKLIDGLLQIMNIIFHSVDYIIKEELNNLEEHYKDANYEIIIYQAFSLVNKCISSSPFKEDFYDLAKGYIFFKIFPFLTLDLGDSELFKESPDEYYLQVIDTMTEFSFKKIKTICGKTLALICENYPDKSYVILNTNFELLIYFMEEFDQRNLYKYSLINNEIGEFFIENYNNESLINVALLCICILAKQAMINFELKKSLHKFLLSNQMRLENVASEKIKFKVCLLYGLFLDALFDISIPEDKEFIKTAINFLLSIILYSNKVKEKNGLSYQAYHSMEQIIENNELCAITNDLVKDYYNQIIESIPNSSLLIFFDMLNIFVDKITVIRDNIVFITKCILQKIDNDLKEIKDGNDNEGIFSNFIHKELAVIANIVNNFSKSEIETKVYQFIVDFIKNNGSNEFVEEIINIIVNFSKKKDKSNLIIKMLNDSSQIIYEYYKSSHYLDLTTFKILNYLILNNKKENTNIILLMNKLILDSLQKIEDIFYGQENIICTLSLIICWLISSRNNTNDIQNNQIEKIAINIISIILEKLSKLYEKESSDTNDDNAFLKYLYIAIIYISFIYFSKNTFPLVFDRNYFNNILTYTNDIMIVNNVYFSLKINKLIIFGLSKILYENDFLKMIIVYFKDAFIINYNLISKQLAQEKKELKMRDKIKELKNEKNYENNENENHENNKNNNYNYMSKKLNDIIVKELILPKLDLDEYDIFNKLYKKLIGLNETKILIEQILGKMDKNEKKDFENILLTKQINVIKDNGDDMVDENTVEKVHRKTVKIKHNLK